MASLLVGIAGGSGSGKTTLAKAVVESMAPGQVVVISHDAYYRDLGHLPFDQRAGHNFDEPDALDNERLLEDLRRLRAGKTIARPNYDFTTHTRRSETTLVEARPVVLVEGILVLAVSALLAVLDLKVFVETAEGIRLARRIDRDMAERGRTREGAEMQFLRFTRPMHDLHVEPSRGHAQVVVSGEEPIARTVAAVLVAIRGQQNPGIRA